MLNRIIQPLPDVPYDAAAVRTVDLEQGLYTQGFLLTIQGEYAIAAGGGVATAARTEGAIRLLDQFTIKWDNFNLFDNLNGLDLAALARVYGNHVIRTPLDIGVAGQGNFAASYFIPVARSWNDKPPASEFDLAWPAFKVTSQLRAYVKWSSRVVTAGDDPGTGALFIGGDRAITWVQEPTLTIVQVCALRGGKPWYIPVYSTQDSQDFSAAQSQLTYQLVDQRAFDSVILQARGATATEPDAWQDLITTLALRGSSVSFYNDVKARDQFAIQRLAEHRHDVQGLFDGTFVNASNAFNTGGNIVYGVGTAAFPEFLPLWLNIADGGLGNKFNPREISTPKFQFAVTAPATPPARVHMIFSQLLSHPLYTKMQDAPA